MRRGERWLPPRPEVWVQTLYAKSGAGGRGQTLTPLDEQVMKAKAGEVRFKIGADGQPGTIFFMTSAPFDTFNAGGQGDFKLTTRSGSRIEGRWVLAQPEDFFGKTFDFDLNFAAEVLGGKR